MRRTLGSLLLALLALCLLHGTAPAQRGADRTDVRELLERNGCQTSLPGSGEAADGPGSDASDSGSAPRGSRRIPRRERRNGEFELGGAGAGIAQPLLWTVVAAAVVLLAIAIVRGLRERGRAIEVRTPTPRIEPVATSNATPEAVPDHERLAAAGDFAAALHAVLARAIAQWIRRGGAVPANCTARGLLQRIPADRLPRSAFAGMVAAAEAVWFAGRAADRSAYESARDLLQQWEAACQQSP